MSRSFRYYINKEKGAVMLSLAFEMTPNFAPPMDTTGMSKPETALKPFPKEPVPSEDQAGEFFAFGSMSLRPKTQPNCCNGSEGYWANIMRRKMWTF